MCHCLVGNFLARHRNGDHQVPLRMEVFLPFKKEFLLARRSTKQPLPVFLELLEELACSWKDRPYSGRSTIPGALSLDCEAMESLGLLRMPHFATYLHPKQYALSSPIGSPYQGGTLLLAMAERAYRMSLCRFCPDTPAITDLCLLV